MKNRTYFINRAIIKTIISGIIYLAMPFLALFYNTYVPDYVGYAIYGAGILIIGNFILLVWSWILVFDNDLRSKYNETMIENHD